MNGTLGGRLNSLSLICLFLQVLTASAQTNSWTKPTTGYWEEPFWSLGELPSSDHSLVEFANPGTKTLIIGTTTTRAYWEPFIFLRRLTILSEAGAVNTLLLTNFGLPEPPPPTAPGPPNVITGLEVENRLLVGDNSGLVLVNSLLRVDGELEVRGTVDQLQSSKVHAYATVSVGNPGRGVYNFNDGILSASSLLVGVPTYTNVPVQVARAGGYEYRLLPISSGGGIFNQDGGLTRISSVLQLGVGEYRLRAGDVHANEVIIGARTGGGSFVQSGGRVLLTNRIAIGRSSGSGSYLLSGGTVTAPGISLGSGDLGYGSFTQTGGSNFVGGITAGRFNRYWGNGGYGLTDGWLESGGISMGAGQFSQSGGTHIVGGISLRGYFERNFAAIRASYVLSGGNLRCAGLNLSIAGVYQSGGTNEIAGTLTVSQDYFGSSSYQLSGGALVTSNTTVMGDFVPAFRHSEGLHEVRGLLDLRSPSRYARLAYALSAGNLIVRDMKLTNDAIFRHTGGSVSQKGTLTLAPGQWEAAPDTHQLGSLKLLTSYSSTNSTLLLPTSPSVVTFGVSSRFAWSSDARLIIEQWNGSVGGNGGHRVIFGRTSSGLTARQLSQIRFRNPIGYQSGEYPATILSSGEIVPQSPTPLAPPYLRYARSGDAFTVQWSPGFILQTATNTIGPFFDVFTSGTSYSLPITADAQRFFRLRN